MREITGWHAHVYFDGATIETARSLCSQCSEIFGITMGRVHDKPVGPHPDWSCQLSVPPEKFAAVMSWLALNRQGLVIFAHPETGQTLEDHRDRAIWMGAVRPLDLSIFATE